MNQTTDILVSGGVLSYWPATGKFIYKGIKNICRGFKFYEFKDHQGGHCRWISGQH